MVDSSFELGFVTTAMAHALTARLVDVAPSRDEAEAAAASALMALALAALIDYCVPPLPCAADALAALSCESTCWIVLEVPTCKEPRTWTI